MELIKDPKIRILENDLDMFVSAKPRKEISNKYLSTLGCPMKYIPLIHHLKTPKLIQEFINTLSYNHDDDRETFRSLTGVVDAKSAHCFEGGIGLAYPLLWLWGYEPRVVLLQADNEMSVDHNIVVYRKHDFLGSVAMSNFETLKSRFPEYKTLHKLVMSYHPYYTADYPPDELEKGTIALRGYTDPIDLVYKFGTDWFFGQGDNALEKIFYSYTDGLMCTDIDTKKRYKYDE